MLIIAGKTYVAAEVRDAYVKDFEEFVRRTRTEPGCLDLVISADPIEGDRVNIFELWSSKQQMDDFRARAEPPETDVAIIRDEVVKYEISATGPPFP